MTSVAGRVVGGTSRISGKRSSRSTAGRSFGRRTGPLCRGSRLRAAAAGARPPPAVREDVPDAEFGRDGDAVGTRARCAGRHADTDVAEGRLEDVSAVSWAGHPRGHEV